eukprot:2006999-Alexandrium_andersonii.AAC.1
MASCRRGSHASRPTVCLRQSALYRPWTAELQALARLTAPVHALRTGAGRTGAGHSSPRRLARRGQQKNP